MSDVIRFNNFYVGDFALGPVHDDDNYKQEIYANGVVTPNPKGLHCDVEFDGAGLSLGCDLDETWRCKALLALESLYEDYKLVRGI